MYYHNLNVIRKGSKKLLTIKNIKSFFFLHLVHVHVFRYMYLLGIMASWAIMVPKLGLQDYQQMIIMICNLLNPFRTKPKYTQDGVYRKSMLKQNQTIFSGLMHLKLDWNLSVVSS